MEVDEFVQKFVNLLWSKVNTYLLGEVRWDISVFPNKWENSAEFSSEKTRLE